MLASISQSVIALVDKLKQRYVVFELCNRQKGNEPRHKGAASVSHLLMVRFLFFESIHLKKRQISAFLHIVRRVHSVRNLASTVYVKVN